MLRLAISLNNMGVSMLGKGCFKDASATLCDAMKIIKSSLSARSSSVERDEYTSFMMRDAILRMTRGGCSTGKNQFVKVLSHNEQELRTIETALYADCRTTPYCFNIDADGSYETITEACVVVTVMYNLALSHFLRAQVERSNKKVTKLHEVALSLFQVTNRILATGFYEERQKGIDHCYRWTVLWCFVQSQELALRRLVRTDTVTQKKIEGAIKQLRRELTTIGLVLYPTKQAAGAA